MIFHLGNVDLPKLDSAELCFRVKEAGQEKFGTLGNSLAISELKSLARKDSNNYYYFTNAYSL